MERVDAMGLTRDQIEAIDARVEERFNALLKLGRFSALGTVVEHVPGTTVAMVVIDGSNQATPVKVYQDCQPRQNDRVGLIKFYGYWHVIANYAHNWPAKVSYNDAAGTGTMASSAFEDTPGADNFDFTKRYDNSGLELGVSASLFITVSSLTGCWWAMRVTGASLTGVAVDNEYNIVHHQFNAQSQSHHFMGEDTFYDVPAGSYNIRLRWRRGSGTGTLNQNTADWVSMWAREVSP
jgi:hypothetical protein